MSNLIQKIKQSKYLKLLAFFTFFAWFLKFSGAALPVYFIKSNLTYTELALGGTLAMLGQVIAVYFLSRFSFSNKKIWLGSMLLYILTFSLYVLYPISHIYFFASFISGFASLLFYGTYSVTHFEVVPRDKTGSGSAMFFNILIITGIITPIISALVATWSIYLLLALSVVFAFIVIYFSRLQEEYEVKFTIRESLEEVKSVRTLIFIHGMQEAVSYGIIPLFTLSLVSSFLGFGAFGTFLGLVGIAVNFIVGKFSDKLNSKSKLLSLFALLLGISTMLYAIPFFHMTIVAWAILNIVNNFIDQIYDQTSLAFVMDETKKRIPAIFGRELVMNGGRFAGMALVFLGYLYPVLLAPVIVVLGLSMVIFAVIVGKMKTQNYHREA